MTIPLYIFRASEAIFWIFLYQKRSTSKIQKTRMYKYIERIWAKWSKRTLNDFLQPKNSLNIHRIFTTTIYVCSRKKDYRQLKGLFCCYQLQRCNIKHVLVLIKIIFYDWNTRKIHLNSIWLMHLITHTIFIMTIYPTKETSVQSRLIIFFFFATIFFTSLSFSFDGWLSLFCIKTRKYYKHHVALTTDRHKPPISLYIYLNIYHFMFDRPFTI